MRTKNEEKILANPSKYWSADPVSGCWIWDRATRPNGYGIVWDGFKLEGAHRLTYRMMVGEIPEKHDLDHLCRVRNCVNPKHLEPVLRKVNARRGAKAVLDESKVLEIRRLNEGGIGYRRLATMFGVHKSTICHLITNRNWKGVTP